MTTFIDLGNTDNTRTLGDDDYVITGGDGSNTLTLGSGNDQLTLGNGNNTLTLGGGTDQITAGTGNNTITINGVGADTITLTNGNNTVTVGGGPDVIFIGDGLNTVTAGDGNDTITLGNGFDQVTTGNGNSRIMVGNGNGDTVYVGTGSNTILLGTGSADIVHAGSGNNTVFVSAVVLGTDSIQGGLNSGNGSQNKLELTTAGIVSATGVSGFEIYQLANGGLNSLTLTDANFTRLPAASITVLGGDSNDTIDAASLAAANSIAIDGGRGYDTVALGYNKAQATLTLQPNGSWTINHGAGADTFTGVELLTFADGGQFVPPGDVTGFGTLSLAAGLTDIAGSIGGEALTFNAPASTIRAHGLQGTTTVTGFQAGDTIDLAGVTGATITSGPGGTTVTAGGGTLSFGAAPTGSALRLYGDSKGGTEVLLDSPPPANAIEYTDVVTHTNATVTGDAYTGPLDYLQRQYIYGGTDPAAMRANTPNVFLKGGVGDDALQVLSGNNVLDGGGGSNFLVGATGADGGSDTFFVDGRGGAETWSTVVNFHQGDQATIFGFHAGTSTLPFTASDGAAGYTGLTIHSEVNGSGTGTLTSLTFAGIDQATADAHFSITTGTLPAGSPGATDYLLVQYNR